MTRAQQLQAAIDYFGAERVKQVNATEKIAWLPPAEDTWVLITARDLELSMIADQCGTAAVLSDDVIHLPEWWTPQRQSILRVKDPRAEVGYTYIDEVYLKQTIPPGVEHVTVDLDTGEEVPA